MQMGTIFGTHSNSNDAWFSKLEIDKTIAKAVNTSCNMCFVVSGVKGAGRDYCLFGGSVSKGNESAANKSSERQASGELQQNIGANKQREPGLIRLAFETIIAQICLNQNAQFSIQISAGLI